MFEDGEIRARINQIQADESKGFGLFWRKVTRIVVRTLRVFFGLLLLGLAAWPGTSAWDSLSIPFATQSFMGILGGLFLAAAAWWLIRVAFMTAFGAGPTAEEDFERQRRQAADWVNANREAQTMNAMRMHRDSGATISYKLGQYIGQISTKK